MVRLTLGSGGGAATCSGSRFLSSTLSFGFASVPGAEALAKAAGSSSASTSDGWTLGTPGTRGTSGTFEVIDRRDLPLLFPFGGSFERTRERERAGIPCSRIGGERSDERAREQP